MAKKAKKGAAEAAPTPYYKVVKEFIDIDNANKRWKIGEDVSHFDKARLEKAIARGLVEKE